MTTSNVKFEMKEDVESGVWSHYTLKPSEQDLDSPLRLTCLVCAEHVMHVAGESRLADHLRLKHDSDGSPDSALLCELQNTESSRLSTMADGDGDLMAFFDPLEKHGNEQTARCKVCGELIPQSTVNNLKEHLQTLHPHLRLVSNSRASNEISTTKAGNVVELINDSETEPLDEAESDIDLMLMASFEAEMKRQIAASATTTTGQGDVEMKSEETPAAAANSSKAAAANSSKEAAANSSEAAAANSSEAAANTSVATSRPLSSATIAVKKSTGKRKRATSPTDIAVGSWDDTKRFRGASTPDNLDDDDSLGLKVEQDEGSKPGFVRQNSNSSCSVTSSERSTRSMRSSQSPFIGGKRVRSDVSDPGVLTPGNSTPQSCSDNNSLDSFSRDSTPSFSRRKRSSSRASSVSSNSSSLAFSSVAESVKRRRESTTGCSAKSSSPPSSIKYHPGVVRKTLHKLTRRCGTLWTASRWTDFDMELVLCRPVDAEKNKLVAEEQTLRGEESVASKLSPSAEMGTSEKKSSTTSTSKQKLSKTNYPSIKHTIVGSYKQLSRNRFSCLLCSKVCRRLARLRIHLRKRHLGKYYACEKCNKKFLTNRYRLGHIDARHRAGRDGAPSSTTSSSSSSKRSLGPKCSKCQLTFRRDYSLKLHRCLVHKKPFRLRTKLISLDDLFDIADPIESRSQEEEEEKQQQEKQVEEEQDEVEQEQQVEQKQEEVPKKNDTQEEVIMCSICEGIYVSRVSFKKHRQSCHRPKPQGSRRKIRLGFDENKCLEGREVEDLTNEDTSKVSNDPLPNDSDRPSPLTTGIVSQHTLSNASSSSSSSSSTSRDRPFRLTSSSSYTATASSPSCASLISSPPKTDDDPAFTASTSSSSSATFLCPPPPPKTDDNPGLTSSSSSSSTSVSLLCPHCIKTFSSYSLLKRHVDVSHNAKAILAARKIEANQSMAQTCTACDDVFLSTQALVKHLAKRHADSEVVSCDWWSWSRDDDEWVQHSKPLVYHM